MIELAVATALHVEVDACATVAVGELAPSVCVSPGASVAATVSTVPGDVGSPVTGTVLAKLVL